MQTRQKNFSEKILTILSNIKVSKWPLFITYRPHSFSLKGSHTRQAMKLVKPGDILVRSFNNYLDGYFMPGTFKQVGFYLSEVNEHHLKQFAHVEHLSKFTTGRQMVIHAIGNQVLLEDLVDFCRCDGLAIMRFPRQLKSLSNRKIPEILQAYFENPIQSTSPKKETEETEEDNVSQKPNFLQKMGLSKRISPRKKGRAEENKNNPEETTKETEEVDAVTAAIVKAEKDIAQYIAHGKVVEFDKIFKVLYRIALKELCTPHHYDFGVDNLYTTTCTELVYFITKSVCWNYGIEAEPTRIFFKDRLVITPDMFVDGHLEEVWKSVM